jgi:type I restriction enzyme S subunit
LKGKVSKAGDSVISMKGTVGRSAFVDEHTRPLAYSPQVSYWRSCDAERIAPTFLYAFIRSDAFVRQCAVVKGSTDMADYVNLADQRNMTLIVPTGREIAAFDRSAGEALRLASRLRNESTNLSAIRDLLLPRLVTGRVDLSALDLLVGTTP